MTKRKNPHMQLYSIYSNLPVEAHPSVETLCQPHMELDLK